MNYDEWHLQHVENLPQQTNGFDCRVFALKYADCAAKDADINFEQKDMPLMRRRMMLEILQAVIKPTEYGEGRDCSSFS